MDAILLAAAQILERGGETGFDTNRIAARAGVSIGTLYQYFSGKQAILVALAERETAALRQQAANRKPRDAVRSAIHDLIWAFEGKAAVRRAVVKAHVNAAPPRELGHDVEATSAFFPNWKALGYRRVDAFVITRAVMGAVRAAVLEDSPFLYKPAFEDALVRLVELYRPSGPSPTRYPSSRGARWSR
ncbi:MAG TPA: TetR/AcrR family transcriptional regulator [Rhizomicrobium sp.]|nr:TetR/AcrR family transcriptional regulator [Rhizomicrobium sp.]